MVTTESVPRGEREYILVKHGQEYWYARKATSDVDTYIIMTRVGQQEGKDIVTAANAGSESTQRNIFTIGEKAHERSK